MDTNYLLKREQVSLMMARQGACLASRHAHAGLARAYGALLAGGTFPHRQFDTVAANDTQSSDIRVRDRAEA